MKDRIENRWHDLRELPVGLHVKAGVGGQNHRENRRRRRCRKNENEGCFERLFHIFLLDFVSNNVRPTEKFPFVIGLREFSKGCDVLLAEESLNRNRGGRTMLTLLLTTAIATTYAVFRINELEAEPATIRKTLSEPQQRR